MYGKLNTDKVTGFLTKIFIVFGIWKPRTNKYFSFAYTVYGIIFLLLFLVLYTFLMLANLFVMPNYNDLTARLYMSLTELALLIKVINFYFYNRRMQYLLHWLQEFTLEKVSEVVTVKARIDFLFKAICLYFFVSIMTINALGVNTALNTNNTLLFSGWYPGLDWQYNNRDYWIVFAYQYVGVFITCNLNVGVDSFFCVLLYMVSSQMTILGKRLMIIGKLPNRESIFEKRLKLIENIKTHRNIVSMLEMLQNCLRWAFLSQIGLSVIVICSITNELARVRLLQQLIY